MKLYGVDDTLLKIFSTAIVKETDRQYFVKEALNAYGYDYRISKEHPMIAFSRAAALAKFEKLQEDRIEGLEEEIVLLKQQLRQVKNNYALY